MSPYRTALLGILSVVAAAVVVAWTLVTLRRAGLENFAGGGQAMRRCAVYFTSDTDLCDGHADGTLTDAERASAAYAKMMQEVAKTDGRTCKVEF